MVMDVIWRRHCVDMIWGRVIYLIINTWFQHHKRHLYTWKSPGDGAMNPIDYSVGERTPPCGTPVLK